MLPPNLRPLAYTLSIHLTRQSVISSYRPFSNTNRNGTSSGVDNMNASHSVSYNNNNINHTITAAFFLLPNLVHTTLGIIIDVHFIQRHADRI